MTDYKVVKTQEVVSQGTVSQPVKEEPPQQAYNKKKVIFRTYQVIWYVLGVVEVLLLFRVTLKMLAANPASGFTNFIYTLSDPLAMPFYGIFPTNVTSGSVFEWSTFLAMLVYLIIAFGLVELFKFLKPVGQEEVEQTVDNP